MNDFKSIDGGVTAAQGISACGVSAGFRRNPERLDLALVVSDEPCTAAGVFTQNIFCAAPVTVSRKHVASGRARAVVMNSGNANAATGEPGLRVAEGSAQMVADSLGCSADDVLVCSTGVIGVPLSLDLFATGVPQAVAALSADGGSDAAHAIMTTDTVAKEYAVSFDVEGMTYHLGGMVKGSGMIMPNMATMLAVITTDAAVDPEDARGILHAVVDDSFNKVTVDSDTSTNDTCLFLATGAVGGPVINAANNGFQTLVRAARTVCVELAKMVARDGEGATKLVEVEVEGAQTDEDADLCARAIANSPLVKTAIAGHDANWGRIAMAAGKSGAHFQQEDVDIDILGIPVCRKGLTVPFDEDDALKRFEAADVSIHVNLGAGVSSTKVWTCDLTNEYVHINGDYRS